MAIQEKRGSPDKVYFERGQELFLAQLERILEFSSQTNPRNIDIYNEILFLRNDPYLNEFAIKSFCNGFDVLYLSVFLCRSEILQCLDNYYQLRMCSGLFSINGFQVLLPSLNSSKASVSDSVSIAFLGETIDGREHNSELKLTRSWVNGKQSVVAARIGIFEMGQANS